MKETDYAGIDYSGPGSTVNRDAETGIRYGMISQNSVCSDAVADVCYNGVDEGFLYAKEQMTADVKNAIIQAMDAYGTMDDDTAQQWASDIVEGDGFEWADCQESGPFSYEHEGYKLQTTSDNNLWVFKSPYYTRAQFCSPCVPGAGNLDCFCNAGPKTYCLHHDWFEDEKAPYDIWSVESNELIYSVPLD